MHAIGTSTFPLSRYVEDVRTVAGGGGRTHRVDRLPDGRTALVFRLVDGGRGDVTVVGPRTRALLKEATGFAYAVLLQFEPGWSTPLLGVSARELTDAFVPLEDIWGRAGHELLFDLLATTCSTDALGHITSALARRVPREPASASLARRAARLIEAGEARVERVADRLGVTARHLRRAFAENIGIGPKEFARSIRLQRAVRMAAASRDWSRIAADAGYYDQAHLITDFRNLVGLTPTAFLKRASERHSPPAGGHEEGPGAARLGVSLTHRDALG
ncbi:MAG TPA: helix-turn-helix transcriptional regulator [Microbacterium sp.]|nr:helix-turn-helix transcriptional regulator [Microbacterium sp.]